MSDLPQIAEFRSHFRKVYQFKKTAKICGEECEIYYWVGDDPDKETLHIAPDGRKLLESFTGYGEIFNART